MNIKKIAEFINIENNKFIFIIILVGVCFMLFSPNGEDKAKTESIKTEEYTAVQEEERLKKILSGIKGVGEVEVMITYYSGVKSDIAYETKSKSSLREDGGDIDKENNSDKMAVMSDGEPFIIKSVYPDVKGVLVVCEGADNVVIQEKIITAVSTALGVAQHRVCVEQKE